jgi:hypothetical protein
MFAQVCTTQSGFDLKWQSIKSGVVFLFSNHSGTREGSIISETSAGRPAAQFCRIFAPVNSSSPDAFARTLVPLIVMSPFFSR